MSDAGVQLGETWHRSQVRESSHLENICSEELRRDERRRRRRKNRQDARDRVPTPGSY